jgi:hypothetical protein
LCVLTYLFQKGQKLAIQKSLDKTPKENKQDQMDDPKMHVSNINAFRSERSWIWVLSFLALI